MDHTTIEHQIERRRKRRRGIIALLSALAAAHARRGLVLARPVHRRRHVDLVVHGRVDRHRLEPTVVAAVTGMMPGDVGRPTDLIVTNLGTAHAPLRDDDDGDERARQRSSRVEVRGVDVDTVGCGSFDGARHRRPGTTLNGAAFGNPAQGADAGDRVLAGGANEMLCFRVERSRSSRARHAPGRDVPGHVHVRRRADRSTTRNPLVGCTGPGPPSAGRGRTRIADQALPASADRPADEEEQRHEDPREGHRVRAAVPRRRPHRPDPRRRCSASSSARSSRSPAARRSSSAAGRWSRRSRSARRSSSRPVAPADLARRRRRLAPGRRRPTRSSPTASSRSSTGPTAAGSRRRATRTTKPDPTPGPASAIEGRVQLVDPARRLPDRAALDPDRRAVPHRPRRDAARRRSGCSSRSSSTRSTAAGSRVARSIPTPGLGEPISPPGQPPALARWPPTAASARCRLTDRRADRAVARDPRAARSVAGRRAGARRRPRRTDGRPMRRRRPRSRDRRRPPRPAPRRPRR